MPILFASGWCFREFRTNYFTLLDCYYKTKKKEMSQFENLGVIKRVFGGDVLIGRSRLTAERSPRVSVKYISQYRADVASSSPEWDSFLVWCEIFLCVVPPSCQFCLWLVLRMRRTACWAEFYVRYVPIVYAYLVGDSYWSAIAG